MTIMDVQYVYCKTRQEFGKQCVFDFDGPVAIENIEPDPQLRREFISKDPYHIASQISKQYAVHQAQTKNVELTETGMFHCEGGWPKEVNFKDEEATSRIRKRIIRSENWAPMMKNLMTPIEYFVKQNNAINIYENYFDEMVPSKLVFPLTASFSFDPSFRAVNIYADPQLNTRPITNISWSRHGGKMIVSHCSMDFQRSPFGLSTVSYLWAIENPGYPLVTLNPKSPSVTIEFSPRHSSLLVSGQTTGQVAFWDLRTAKSPIAESHRLYSHSDPASIVQWIDTTTHCEFASASTDGLIKWWDIRKIREPTQTLAMDLSNPETTEIIKSVGISSMNNSSSSGTKFMVGLENGIVINGSVKAKSDGEKLGSRFKCHFGPVVSVHRSPFIPKFFMTVGDWTSRIWAEDTKESCLASTEYRSKKGMLTAGCWSTSRVSVFYVIGSTGEFEVWDLLSGMNKPVEMLKLGKDPLTRIRPHENGKFIAVGNRMGKVYLVESSEALTTNRKNDKALLTVYLENCSRYEKSVDNRLREMRYTQRLKHQDPEISPNEQSKENYRVNGTRIATDPDEDGVKIDVNENVNKKTSEKVDKTTSLLLDFDLIEPEKEYFALVEEVRRAILGELKKYGNLVSEHDSDELLESDILKHHQKQAKHNWRSYKNKKPTKKYKKPVQTTHVESSASPELSQVSEIKEEVIKPASISPKLTKRRKRSPKPCAVQVSSEICRPKICCKDLKNAPNKGNELMVKEEDLPNKRQESPKKNKEGLVKTTKTFFSATEKVLNEPILHSVSPASMTTPSQQVEGLKSSKLEKYYNARMADVKDFSAEDKAKILKGVTARPSTILLEVLLAKKRIDEEAERIRSREKKEGSGETDKAKVTASLVQVTEAEEKINPEDNVLNKMEDVEPGSSPTVRPVHEGKIKEQKLSPNQMTSYVMPRKALTALQVTPAEIFKPLPKLSERQYYFSQKETYEDRMYPRSSAFPPLPRIVLPKLLERPPDPTIFPEEGVKGRKVRRKVKSGGNKAEKSRSQNN